MPLWMRSLGADPLAVELLFLLPRFTHSGSYRLTNSGSYSNGSCIEVNLNRMMTHHAGNDRP